MRLKNQQVRSLSEDVCGVIDKILKALKEQPEDIPTVRQFFNYYLPTFGDILLSFLRLGKSGVPAADTTEKVIACLAFCFLLSGLLAPGIKSIRFDLPCLNPGKAPFILPAVKSE